MPEFPAGVAENFASGATFAGMKVAITHDWLNQFGGAERVLLEMRHLFPDAPVYTTVCEPSRLPEEMRSWDIRTSFLQRLPFARRKHQPYLPLMPIAFEQFDMSGFELVVTTSSACAKGIIPAPGAVNICYCYTPCRYIWDLYHEYTRGLPARPLIGAVAHWLRVWDQLSSQRVDHFVAISHEVAARIRRHYGREAEVIHPPVSVDFFQPSGSPPEDFYLVVSRLVPYKRIDLAVEAANLLRRRLIVVGDGPQRTRLEALAGPTIEFLGRRDDREVAELYSRCRAVLFPGLEDFGIVPVEAQAAGRPVIAFGRGGALDSVVPGASGLFFDEQTATSLARAITEFEQMRWDAERCRRQAERFDRRFFLARLRNAVERELDRAAGGSAQRKRFGEYLELA
jgi:glycosyltransferase involved in cell wall biosynthesis